MYAMPVDESCPVCRTADIVCGKWTLLIVRDLSEGRSRFCQLERSLGGIGMDLGAVHGEHLRAHQTGIRAQRQDLAKKPGQRLLVALTEPRDRRVVRDLVRGEDAKRDVFLAGALDRSRRPNSTRVGVKQSATMTAGSNAGRPCPSWRYTA